MLTQCHFITVHSKTRRICIMRQYVFSRKRSDILLSSSFFNWKGHCKQSLVIIFKRLAGATNKEHPCCDYFITRFFFNKEILLIKTSSNTMPITNSRVIPLTCSGHTRPVVDLQFSSMDSDNNYLLISACKG